MHEGELAQAFDDIWNKSSTRNWIIGRLGVDSGTPEAIDVAGREGYVVVSMGPQGDQGITIAKDKVGVAKVVFQEVRMRRELGELVIREASAYAGGNGTGGGGSTDLDGLTDVTISSPSSGQSLVYNGSQWVNQSGGAGMVAHDINGIYHTGDLQWDKIDFANSSIDDLADHAHSSLSGVTPNNHHPHVHPIVGGDALGVAAHTVVGSKFDVVGLTANNVLGLLVPSSDPGGTEKLLKTSPDGSLALDSTLFAINAAINEVSIDTTLFVADADTRKVSIDTLLFVADGVNDRVTIASTLMDANASLQSVAFDSDLLVINAAQDKVSIKGSFFVADPGAQLITIDTNLLYIDTANNRIGINTMPDNPGFGAATLSIIAANDADHTQRIKQKVGQTGRMWRLESHETVDPHELIVIDSVGNMQSGYPGFVSGLTGWQISPQGNAEFNNIWARGELHATVFVKDEVHATGGTLLVATAATVYEDAQIDSAAAQRDDLMVESTAAAFPGAGSLPLQIETTSASFEGTALEVEAVGNVILINDPPSGPGLYFTPGEIIRVKTEVATGVTDFWFVVQNATLVAADEEAGIKGHNRLSVTHKSGGGPTQSGLIPKGAALVSYGHPGDGRILLTSDWQTNKGTNGVGDDSYAPYIDVFNIGDAPWTGDAGQIIPRMRMGQLKGVGLPGVSGMSQWGMIAGSDLTDANSGYLIASNLGIRMYKVPLTFNNGSSDTGLWDADGNIRIGKNIAQNTTTGFRVITKSNQPDEEGNVIIGNEATGHFLRWQQTQGILTVSGSLTIQDAGTTVTKTYVDAQDQSYDLLAQSYGGNAFTSSKGYVNDRRLVKVEGTWTSGTNLISWTTVALHFANSAGSPRSVTNGNTGTLSVRMYLYVDLAQAGTLTMFGRTTQVVNDPNYVLIAVCDPGANGTLKASVTVVGGSTYISGGNIVTQSIVTNSIAALAINAGHIQGGQILVSHLDPSTTDYIINGDTGTQNNAQNYGNRRRLVSVGRTDGAQGWGFGFDNNFVSWTSLIVRFADGSQQSIANGSTNISGASPFTYLYVNVVSQGTTGPLTLSSTTSITALGPDHVVVAVVEPAIATSLGGSGWPTFQAVAGATFISGDSIITGSIVAQTIAAGAIATGHLQADAVKAGTIDALAVDTRELAAGAVTAEKISVASLSAVDTNTGSLAVTGSLTMGTAGKIFSTGKDSYAADSGVAGFFLGYEGGYKFYIGDNNAYLRWTGTDLQLRTKYPITFKADGNDDIFYFEEKSPGNHTAILSFEWITADNRGQMSTSVGFKSNYRLEAPSIMLTDAFGGSSHEVIIFNFTGSPASRRAMVFNSGTQLLSYTGDFATSQSLFCENLFANGGFVRVADQSTFLGATTIAGTIGDIRWGWHNPSQTWCLFVYMGGGSDGSASNPGWYRVGMTRL